MKRIISHAPPSPHEERNFEDQDDLNAVSANLRIVMPNTYPRYNQGVILKQEGALSVLVKFGLSGGPCSR